MKNIISTIMMTTICIVGHSQGGNSPDLAINSSSYRTAIGLRGGETSGLTIKHFMNDRNAIEGIVGLWHHGLSATVLYERHQNAFDVRGLNWYYGAGGHATFASSYSYYKPYKDRYRKHYQGRVGLGVDGIIGIEYKIPKAPFALSLDLKPFVEIGTYGYWYSSIDPGLGIKVTF